MATGVFIARVIACSHGCSHVQRSRGSSRGRTGVGVFACSRGFSHVRGWSWVFAVFACSGGCSRGHAVVHAIAWMVARSRVRVCTRLFACSHVPVGVHMFAGGRGCLRVFACSGGGSRGRAVVHAIAWMVARSRVRGCTRLFACSHVHVGV